MRIPAASGVGCVEGVGTAGLDGIEWVADAFDTYCLTFAWGLSPEELVGRLGGDVSAMLPSASPEQVSELDSAKGSAARMGVCAGWAFSVERWSAEGMDRAALRTVSEGTDAVVLLCSGASPLWFLHARDGVVLADFEPGVEADQLGGHSPEHLLSAMMEVGLLLPDGTSAEDVDERRLILRTAETVFGLSLPREDLLHGRLAAVSLSGI
jgi:hypothetical protein